MTACSMAEGVCGRSDSTARFHSMITFHAQLSTLKMKIHIEQVEASPPMVSRAVAGV